MIPRLDDHQTRLLRMRSQRLDPAYQDPVVSPEQCLKAMFGAQAQDLPAARLSIRARTSGLTDRQVEQARSQERTIAWTWLQRGTLHLHASSDLLWLIPLLGPDLAAAGVPRLRQLGWDEERTNAGLKLLQETLEERGELLRSEIRPLLQAHHLPFETQAPVHLLYRAALKGILCAGPQRGKQNTYVPFEPWLGKLQPLPLPEALAELARRYLQAYAPASAPDLAAWAGIKATTAREAWRLIEGEMAEVEAAGKPAWMLKSQLKWLDEPSGPNPVVRLIPRYDTYLLGYTNRDLAVDSGYARHVHPGGGIIYPSLLVDGRAQGVWKTSRKKQSLEVSLQPFQPLPPTLLPALQSESTDLARFLEIPHNHLRIDSPITPAD